MKRVILTVCCIALGSFTVLAQKKAAEASAMSDQQFVDFAAQTDMVEANLGQLAQAATFVFKSLREFPFLALISCLRLGWGTRCRYIDGCCG